MAQIGIFSEPHRAHLTGFFFGADDTKVDVLTYWFEDGADAIQAASDLRFANPGADVFAKHQPGSSIAPYCVAMYRRAA